MVRAVLYAYQMTSAEIQTSMAQFASVSKFSFYFSAANEPRPSIDSNIRYITKTVPFYVIINKLTNF